MLLESMFLIYWYFILSHFPSMKKIPTHIYFFGIGGIIALVCGYFAQDMLSFEKNATSVIGTVIDFDISNKGGCSPNVSYRVNGKDYINDSWGSTKPCPYEEWEKIEMLYNPENPKDAIIDSFLEKWLFITIFGIIAGIILLVGFVFLKKEQRKQWLIWNGISIQVPVKETGVNYHYTANGKHPWIITAEYDDGSGNIFEYVSDNIWFNPDIYTDKTVSVFVNPVNYKEYYMDISFLPDEDIPNARVMSTYNGEE